MWTLQGTWSAQAALSLPPQWPKQEQEAPGKDSIRNIPAAMLHQVRMEGLLHLNPFSLPKGTTALVALVLARIATHLPSLMRARQHGTRHPWNMQTQLL